MAKIKIKKGEVVVMTDVFHTITYEDKYYSIFVDAYNGLMDKLPCEFIIIHYIALNKNNIFLNNEYGRLDFNKYCNKFANKEFSLASINKAIKCLKDIKRIILVKKGVYKLNAKYFYNGSRDKRIEEIKKNEELLIEK